MTEVQSFVVHANSTHCSLFTAASMRHCPLSGSKKLMRWDRHIIQSEAQLTQAAWCGSEEEPLGMTGARGTLKYSPAQVRFLLTWSKTQPDAQVSLNWMRAIWWQLKLQRLCSDWGALQLSKMQRSESACNTVNRINLFHLLKPWFMYKIIIRHSTVLILDLEAAAEIRASDHFLKQCH